MRPLWLMTLLPCLLLAACGQPEPAKPTRTTAPVAAKTALLPAAATAQLAQLNSQLQTLAQAAQTLTQAPTEANLSAAQTAWQTTYTSFNHSLDWLLGNARNQALITQRIDPLPIQPGYVDALKLWPDSGLVNDPTVTLDAATLVQQNQPTDDTEASLGFQVVQFLLWGSAELPRKASDFTLARRARYLTLVTQQLTQDVQSAIERCEQQGCDAAIGKQQVTARHTLIKTAASGNEAYVAAMSVNIAND